MGQIPSAGRGRPAQFVPIRFVFGNKLTRDAKLLLAFDALELSEVLSREVRLGKIVYGENYATLMVKTSALAGDVSTVAASSTAKLLGVSGISSPRPAATLRRCWCSWTVRATTCTYW